MGRSQKKTCSYFGCRSNSAENPEKRFFTFPTRNCQEWVEACRNEKLLYKSRNNLKTHYYVCCDHFSDSQYQMVLPPFTRKLKLGIVPGPSSISGDDEDDDPQSNQKIDFNSQGQNITSDDEEIVSCYIKEEHAKSCSEQNSSRCNIEENSSCCTKGTNVNIYTTKNMSSTCINEEISSSRSDEKNMTRHIDQKNVSTHTDEEIPNGQIDENAIRHIEEKNASIHTDEEITGIVTEEKVINCIDKEISISHTDEYNTLCCIDGKNGSMGECQDGAKKAVQGESSIYLLNLQPTTFSNRFRLIKPKPCKEASNFKYMAEGESIENIVKSSRAQSNATEVVSRKKGKRKESDSENMMESLNCKASNKCTQKRSTETAEIESPGQKRRKNIEMNIEIEEKNIFDCEVIIKEELLEPETGSDSFIDNTALMNEDICSGENKKCTICNEILQDSATIQNILQDFSKTSHSKIYYIIEKIVNTSIYDYANFIANPLVCHTCADTINMYDELEDRLENVLNEKFKITNFLKQKFEKNQQLNENVHQLPLQFVSDGNENSSCAEQSFCWGNECVYNLIDLVKNNYDIISKTTENAEELKACWGKINDILVKKHPGVTTKDCVKKWEKIKDDFFNFNKFTFRTNILLKSVPKYHLLLASFLSKNNEQRKVNKEVLEVTVNKEDAEEFGFTIYVKTIKTNEKCIVNSVTKGGVADFYGLMKGDVILSYNQNLISTLPDQNIEEMLKLLDVEKSIKLVISREKTNCDAIEVCALCSKKLMSLIEFNKHLDSHKINKFLCCPACNFKTPHNRHFDVHINKVCYVRKENCTIVSNLMKDEPIELKMEKDEFIVENIVCKKVVKGRTYYLIKWQHWDHSEDTWEPAEHVYCKEAVKNYEKGLNQIENPPFTFNKLIAQAIISSEDKISTLEDIIKFIQTNYPVFKTLNYCGELVQTLLKSGIFEQRKISNEKKNNFWKIKDDEFEQVEKYAYIPVISYLESKQDFDAIKKKIQTNEDGTALSKKENVFLMESFRGNGSTYLNKLSQKKPNQITSNESPSSGGNTKSNLNRTDKLDPKNVLLLPSNYDSGLMHNVSPTFFTPIKKNAKFLLANNSKTKISQHNCILSMPNDEINGTTCNVNSNDKFSVPNNSITKILQPNTNGTVFIPINNKNNNSNNILISNNNSISLFPQNKMHTFPSRSNLAVIEKKMLILKKLPKTTKIDSSNKIDFDQLPINIANEKVKKNDENIQKNCPICNVKVDLRLFYLHLNDDHFKQKIHECIICEIKFSKYSDKVKHDIEHHPVEEIVKFNKGLKQKYICPLCSINCKTLRFMIVHMNDYHFKKKIHPCQFCEKLLETKKKLNCHTNKMHRHAQVKCLVCETLVAKKNFRQHLRLTHWSLNEFHCRTCTIVFSSYYKLRIHYQFEHNISKTSNLSDQVHNSHRSLMRYKCKMCDVCYVSKKSVTKHLQTNHDIVIKPTFDAKNLPSDFPVAYMLGSSDEGSENDEKQLSINIKKRQYNDDSKGKNKHKMKKVTNETWIDLPSKLNANQTSDSEDSFVDDGISLEL